jgi:hypothetical protein
VPLDPAERYSFSLEPSAFELRERRKINPANRLIKRELISKYQNLYIYIGLLLLSSVIEYIRELVYGEN